MHATEAVPAVGESADNSMHNVDMHHITPSIDQAICPHLAQRCWGMHFCAGLTQMRFRADLVTHDIVTISIDLVWYSASCLNHPFSIGTTQYRYNLQHTMHCTQFYTAVHTNVKI